MSEGKVKTGCVMITGPDEQMDQRGNGDPANLLPIKCPHCTFPALDFVAQPYLLARGVSSPAETSPAMRGNFLVRERVRRLLEIAVPGACTFHPTADYRTKELTPWWLAVPNRTLRTHWPKPSPPFCPKCGEPKVWWSPMSPFWDRMIDYDSGGVDVFKTLEWGAMATAEDNYEQTNRYRKEQGYPPLPWADWGVEPPPHPERWTRANPWRHLYFSVRLERLLKRLKVKGQLVRYLGFQKVMPTPQDEVWIDTRLKLLRDDGLVGGPTASESPSSTQAERWFREYLKRKARKRPKTVDFAAIEKQHNLTLPKDYKDFISTVGPKSFDGINETEGFRAKVLPPNEMDFQNYRRGKIPDLDEEQSQIDGVMFASTDHGDCFVFDASAKSKDYPVYWWDHEQNTLEAFAGNFAECIHRFVERN